MKYEIINPSDEVFIEADSHEVACVAVACMGEGEYGLKEVGGDLEMPLLLFGTADKWFKKTFDRTFEESFHHIDREELKTALLSTNMEHERTSLNKIVDYAHSLGNRLKME